MTTGTIAIFILFVSFAFSLAYLRFHKKRFLQRNAPRSGENIIALGDSLIKGVGASPGKDFISILAQEIRRPIINAGKSGDTTADALGRLENDVLSQDPRIVIVLLGGNDVRKGITREETFRNLSLMIDKIRNHGATVLLLGVRGGILIDHFRWYFHSLAKEKDIPYVPDVYRGIFTEPGLKHDFLHPNDEGYSIIAKRVAPALKELVRAYYPTGVKQGSFQTHELTR